MCSVVLSKPSDNRQSASIYTLCLVFQLGYCASAFIQCVQFLHNRRLLMLTVYTFNICANTIQWIGEFNRKPILRAQSVCNPFDALNAKYDYRWEVNFCTDDL